MNRRSFTCFSMRLAGFLMLRGFVVFEMRKDQKTNRNVFVFNDSNELRSAVEEYKNFK